MSLHTSHETLNNPIWDTLTIEQKAARLAHNWAVPQQVILWLFRLDEQGKAFGQRIADLEKRNTALETRVSQLEEKSKK